MKSFALLKTNVALTTNLQIVVTSDDKMYMESIDSNQYLSDDKYKKKQFGKDAPYNQLIPTFFKDLEAKYAFEVKYDNDKDEMFDDFSRQFDDIYQAGCANVINTDYNEEFECFAPLHFEHNNFPHAFVIFRVDGPGLIELTKDNFRTEILENLKCVDVFNLRRSSEVGEWIFKSFKDDVTFPEFKFEVDVREGEFSNWSGIDFETGGYTSKSLFMKDVFEKETTFFEMDKLLTDGYQDHKVVYPNIINFKFLFDDTPATKTSLRKWSINRYYGFYANTLQLIKAVTPYSPPKLKSTAVIGEDNVFNGDPFEKGYVDGKSYVEYFGQFYLVISFSNDTKYKVIAPFDLSGKQDKLNKNVIQIDDDNVITFDPNYNTDTFEVPCFDKADVWIIQIDQKYHILKKEGEKYVINTDYGFTINNNKLDYWVNESDPSYRTTIQLDNVDSVNPPLYFPIFKMNFTDIKEFDTSVVNTDYARYEYEKSDEISQTLEPKLFVKDENSLTNPREFNEYIFNNELVKIPASSEYVGTSELFEIKNNNSIDRELSDVWRKNALFCKWGYEGSLSNGDYPYRLNNNFYGEDTNRSTNIYELLPNRVERNLDYFYTINPDSLDYIDHTLHITKVDKNGDLDLDAEFEVDKYFNVGTVSLASCTSSTPIYGTYCNNYFDYLFTGKEYLDNGNIVRNTNKYSTFLKGDDSVPNMTLFRGMKFKVYAVDKVLTTSDQFGKVSISNISLLTNNNYEDWSFSILLSDFKHDIDDENFSSDPQQAENLSQMQWDVLDTWKLEESYEAGDTVLHHEVMFISNTASTIDDPADHPGKSNDWDLGTASTAFWSPNQTYNLNNWTYNSGEFYYRSINLTNGEFYNPAVSGGVGYPSFTYVIYKNDFYKSKVSSNKDIPTVTSKWDKVFSIPDPKWIKVEQWSHSRQYIGPRYVYYQGALYSGSLTSQGDIPDTSNKWNLVYSFEADTDKIYGTTVNDNSIVQINNRFLLMVSNPNNETLNSGINIYFHKKWKNILVNIYVNDNTMFDIRNTNRDDLYHDMNQKLTAKNFLEALNDLDDKRSFANHINYYIIENDYTFTKYNIDNITDLPVMLTVEDPDEFGIYLDSMKRTPITVNTSVLNPTKKLDDNEIDSITDLDFYNGNPIGIELKKSVINGNNNVTFANVATKSTMYRFNGNYSPIFREVELFKRPELTNDIRGNYIFDTELTNFGIMKERILSKVNLTENVFKLRGASAFKSVYPQMDEFGYTFEDHFIFKSTWDKKYYIKVDK